MYFFLLLFFLHLKRSFQIDQRGGEANTRHSRGGEGETRVEGIRRLKVRIDRRGSRGGETERDVRPGRGAGA